MTDLRKLSEAATPGKWATGGHSLYSNENGFSDLFQCSHGEGGRASQEDAAFIVALVNAYRSGSLIPRSEHEHLLELLGEAREAGSKVLTRGETLEMRKARTRLRNVLSRIDDTLAAEREARG